MARRALTIVPWRAVGATTTLPPRTVSSVNFTLKAVDSSGSSTGTTVIDAQNIGKTTIKTLTGLNANQWYKWWVELIFTDGKKTGAGRWFQTKASQDPSAPTITSVSPNTLTLGPQNTTIDIYGTGFSNENSSYPRVWIAGIALEGVTSDSTAPAEFVSDTHIRITTTEVYGGLDAIRCVTVRNSSDDSTLAAKDNAITVITATIPAPTISGLSSDQTLKVGESFALTGIVSAGSGDNLTKVTAAISGPGLSEPNTTAMTSGTIDTASYNLNNFTFSATTFNQVGEYTIGIWAVTNYYSSAVMVGQFTITLKIEEQAPSAPFLTLNTEGPVFTLSLNTAPKAYGYTGNTSNNADGYTVYYAPYPYQGENSIKNFDIGNKTSLTVTLNEGNAFYVAAKAYNSVGYSPYSNIEHFTVGAHEGFFKLLRPAKIGTDLKISLYIDADLFDKPDVFMYILGTDGKLKYITDTIEVTKSGFHDFTISGDVFGLYGVYSILVLDENVGLDDALWRFDILIDRDQITDETGLKELLNEYSPNVHYGDYRESKYVDKNPWGYCSEYKDEGEIFYPILIDELRTYASKLDFVISKEESFGAKRLAVGDIKKDIDGGTELIRYLKNPTIFYEGIDFNIANYNRSDFYYGITKEWGGHRILEPETGTDTAFNSYISLINFKSLKEDSKIYATGYEDNGYVFLQYFFYYPFDAKNGAGFFSEYASRHSADRERVVVILEI